MVWEAWRRVKANKGAPGVDGQDLEEFEADLADNLYRIWNRMSSGSYFPPPVKDGMNRGLPRSARDTRADQ
jgi:retron-type reverse transcriptase